MVRNMEQKAKTCWEITDLHFVLANISFSQHVRADVGKLNFKKAVLQGPKGTNFKLRNLS